MKLKITFELEGVEGEHKHVCVFPLQPDQLKLEDLWMNIAVEMDEFLRGVKGTLHTKDSIQLNQEEKL